MNHDMNWEKVIEWPQNDTIYIIHILINQQQLSIEVEDKYSGDIWQNIFTPNGIQDLTAKAKNQKKYPVFVKMLTSALLKSSQSLKAEILSYRQLSSRFGRGNPQPKTLNPQQTSKRFLILIYFGEFQKMQFPLPLLYDNQVTSDRLKLTIKRMSQELSLLRDGQNQSELTKQLALVKYQNESLKNKLKLQPKSENSMIVHPKTQDLQKDIYQKDYVINQLQQKVKQSQDLHKQSLGKLKQSTDRVKQLEKTIKQSQKQKTSVNKNLAFYDEKLEQLMDQMKKLHQQLLNARLKEQKSQQQIENLQTELQKMMANNKPYRKGFSNIKDNSSSDKNSQRSLSVKSGRSNTSQKSLTKTRNINRKTYGAYGQQQSHLTSSNSKKQLSNKKPSIYDSDTESSRMRRMANGRSSPYRQTANPANKKNQKLIDQLNRSRSKSKEKQRRITPKQSVVVYSQLMTEGYNSDSQREQTNKIVYEKKKQTTLKQQNNLVQTNNMKVNQKLRNLQQLIKKASQSKKERKQQIK